MGDAFKLDLSKTSGNFKFDKVAKSTDSATEPKEAKLDKRTWQLHSNEGGQGKPEKGFSARIANRTFDQKTDTVDFSDQAFKFHSLEPSKDAKAVSLETLAENKEKSKAASGEEKSSLTSGSILTPAVQKRLKNNAQTVAVIDIASQPGDDMDHGQAVASIITDDVISETPEVRVNMYRAEMPGTTVLDKTATAIQDSYVKDTKAIISEIQNALSNPENKVLCMSLQNPQIYAIAGALESTMVRPDGTPMFEDQFNPALYKEIFGRDVKDKPITSLREQTTKIRDYVENVFNSDPDIKAVNDEMTTLLAQAESRGVYMADSVGNAKELPVMLGYDTKVDIPLSTSFSEWSKSPHVFGIAASEHDGATAARDVYNQFIAPFSSIGEDGKGYGSSGNFTPYAAMDGVNVMAAQYAAPGTEIDYNKQASYGIAMPFDGTSASAPRFAATLAQMLALNPKLTREQIDEAFAATSIDSPFHDDVEEGEMGIINREAAVMYVAENFMADAPPKLKLTP